MPEDCGSTRFSVSWAATIASTALPPRAQHGGAGLGGQRVGGHDHEALGFDSGALGAAAGGLGGRCLLCPRDAGEGQDSEHRPSLSQSHGGSSQTRADRQPKASTRFTKWHDAISRSFDDQPTAAGFAGEGDEGYSRRPSACCWHSYPSSGVGGLCGRPSGSRLEPSACHPFLEPGARPRPGPQFVDYRRSRCHCSCSSPRACRS